MTKEYDDIIHLPRHVSKTRPPMAIIDRAAQFSPFAALTGHDAAIKETERLTDDRVELDEYMKEALNNKLQILIEHLKEQPEVTICYFQPDEKKNGGAYLTTSARIKKIDQYEQKLLMIGGKVIPISEIIGIEGEIFNNFLD